VSNRPHIPAKDVTGNSDVFTNFMRKLIRFRIRIFKRNWTRSAKRNERLRTFPAFLPRLPMVVRTLPFLPPRQSVLHK
jgi:hypothetical protein